MKARQSILTLWTVAALAVTGGWWLVAGGWWLAIGPPATAVPLVGASWQSPGTATTDNQPPTTNHQPPTTITLPQHVLLPCSLSFRIWNGLLTVDGIVGKAGLQRFVVNAGQNECTLIPRAAQLAVVPAATTQTRVTIYENATTVQQAHVPQIQFNAVRLENLPVGMVDVLALLSPAVARSMDAPVGWLGGSFLAAFQVTFDYDARNILLEKPDAPLPRDKEAIRIPIEVQDNRVILKLTIPGARPFPALFSTSAPVMVIPARVAQQAKLKALEMLSVTQPGGKPGKVGRVLLPKLSVGRVTLEGINAVFIPPDAPQDLSRELAIFGADLLRHYKVTINYKRHMMILVPPASALPKKVDAPDEATDTKKPKRGHQQNN